MTTISADSLSARSGDGSFKLADGIATLFDHFGHDGEDLFIIELDTGIDLYALISAINKRIAPTEACLWQAWLFC